MPSQAKSNTQKLSKIQTQNSTLKILLMGPGSEYSWAMIQEETSAARSYSEMLRYRDRIVAITEQKVMIDGGGPTGLRLAGVLRPEPRRASDKPMGESI
jgi:hypothetical protein